MTAPAAGDPAFNYTSRYSGISIGGQILGAPPPQDYYSGYLSTTDFGLFDEALEDSISWTPVSAASDASQTADLQTSSISVEAWTHMEILSDGNWARAQAWASSDFYVTFDVGEPAPVELTGAVHTPPGCGPPSEIDCSVMFYQRVDASWVLLYDEQYEATVNYAATLAPGQYRLEASAYIAGDSMFGEFPIIGSTFFDIDLQIVPEPASLIMLIPVALWFVRRRG